MKLFKSKHLYVILVSIGLLIIGSLYDLKISQFLYYPNLFAYVLEAIGIFPMSLALCMVSLCSLRILIDEKGLKKFLYFCLILITQAGAFYIIHHEMSTVVNNMPYYILICFVVFVVLLLNMICALLFKDYDVSKLKRFVLFILCFVIISFGLVQALKIIASRPRYYALLEHSELSFKNWYEFSFKENVIEGLDSDFFKSFPSGHMQAGTCLMFLASIDYIKNEKYKMKHFFFALSIIYVLVLAYTRISLGRHFLSDVTTGFLCTYLAYVICSIILLNKKENSLNKEE